MPSQHAACRQQLKLCAVEVRVDVDFAGRALMTGFCCSLALMKTLSGLFTVQVRYGSM
jgi:hypothetical protein